MKNQSAHKNVKRVQKNRKKGAKYRKPVRIIRNVDYQRIEENPLNQFDFLVRDAIGVRPEAFESLMKREEHALILRAIDEAGLSEMEKLCVRLTLTNEMQVEIARKLNLNKVTIRTHLRRAVAKIKAYLDRKLTPNG